MHISCKLEPEYHINRKTHFILDSTGNATEVGRGIKFGLCTNLTGKHVPTGTDKTRCTKLWRALRRTWPRQSGSCPTDSASSSTRGQVHASSASASCARPTSTIGGARHARHSARRQPAGVLT